MKYELGKIDSLIEKYLSPKSPEPEKEKLEDTNTLVIDINNEIARLEKSFEERMFSLKNDKQIERFIQRHQNRLIRICNSIIIDYSIINFKSVPKNISNQFELRYFLYTKLEGLLSYIEKYFNNYFNQDELIPNSYRIIGQMEFRDKLNSHNYPACELASVALYPIKDFITTNQSISFRSLIYLKELHKEVATQCGKCKEPKTDCKLSCNLVYLNFNSFKFYSQIISSIRQEIETESDVQKKIERLSFHLKKLNQAQEKPNFAYKPNQESIKEQLGNWIYEETQHYEKIHQFTLTFPNESVIELKDNFKLTTDMSVPQVAYLIRLMVDTGIILNKNQKEVISFFASHMKTKKTDSISPTSFHNKYYNIDSSTKDDLRQRIIKMLNETQKEV